MMTDKQVIKELVDIVFSLIDGTQHPATVSRAVKFINELERYDESEIPEYDDRRMYLL